MASAGFSTLVSQAAVSLVNNKGNPLKTLKDLSSVENLQNIALNVAAAGLLDQVSETVGVSPKAKGAANQFKKGVVNAGVPAAVSSAAAIAQGEKLSKSLEEGLKGVVVGSIAGMLAEKIGDFRENVGSVGHKALHGTLGAAIGAVLSEKPPKGAITGALGAVLAETLAEAITPVAQDLRNEILEDAHLQGKNLTRGELDDALRSALRKRVDLSKFITASLALVLKQDVDIGLYAANNAVENNFWIHYSMDPDVAQQEMREEKWVAQQIGEVLGTPISALVEFQEGQVHRAVTEVHQLQEILKNPNLSFLERQNLNIQLNNSLEYIGRMQISFPRTVGDVSLLGASVASGLGTGAKVVKDTVSTVKAVRTATKAKSAVAAATALEKQTAREVAKASSEKPQTPYWERLSQPKSPRSPQAPSTAPPVAVKSGSAPATPAQPSNLNVQRLSAPRGEPNAGGYIRSFVTTKDEVYYRVYSEGDVGRFITKVPPKSRALAKEGLALPPSNKATYIQEVHVPAGTRLQRSRALPVSSWDKRGGMEQFQIIEKDIFKIKFEPGKEML